MPKRQSVKKLDSSVVQGEDSFVIFRRLTIAEIKSILKDKGKIFDDVDDAEDDSSNDGVNPAEVTTERLNKAIINIDITSETLADVVIDWNWVDDEDQPLAKPKKNPAVFDELTDDEFGFLSKELGKILSPTVASTDGDGQGK